MSKLEKLSQKLKSAGLELADNEIVNISDLLAKALFAGDDPTGTFGSPNNSCFNTGCVGGNNSSCTNSNCVPDTTPNTGGNFQCTNTGCQ